MSKSVFKKRCIKKKRLRSQCFCSLCPWNKFFFSPERWEIEDRTLFMTLLSTIVPKHSATKTKLKGYYKVNTGHRLSGWDALLFMLTTIQQIAILWYQNSQINHLRLFNTITSTVWDFFNTLSSTVQWKLEPSFLEEGLTQLCQCYLIQSCWIILLFDTL